MKKLFILVALFLTFITGCSKRVVCTKIDKEEMITTEETFMVSYQKEKVSTIQINLNTTLKKDYEDYTETVEKNLKEQFQKYENVEGATVDSSINDNVIRIHLFIELDKMSEKDKKKLSLISLDEDEKTLKKILEKKNYQCS